MHVEQHRSLSGGERDREREGEGKRDVRGRVKVSLSFFGRVGRACVFVPGILC